MARYALLHNAGDILGCHPRTVDNWLRSGFIHGYTDGSRQLFVDIDEIERAFELNPRMRDPRKRYGKAVIVPLPEVSVRAEVAGEHPQGDR